MIKQQPAQLLFHKWLVFFGLTGFFLWLAADLGYLQVLLFGDRTRISLLIFLIFILATCHCGFRAFEIARQLARLDDIIRNSRQQGCTQYQLQDQHLLFKGRPLPISLSSQYLAAVLCKYPPGSSIQESQMEHAQLTEVLSEQARGQHEMGWFIAGLLIKLGLLGTVIGFVMMLAPLADMDSFDVTDVQEMLSQMTIGMSIALNTTLVGLLGSILLGFQYLMLDRGADKLVADVVYFTEVEWLPAQHKAAL